MTADALAWAIGIGFPALVTGLVFLANWLHRVAGQVRDTAQEVANLRAHIAENYVRGHEIAEVKKAVADLRQEMTQVVAELRVELTHKVDELTKAVFQLIGQQQTK